MTEDEAQREIGKYLKKAYSVVTNLHKLGLWGPEHGDLYDKFVESLVYYIEMVRAIDWDKLFVIHNRVELGNEIAKAHIEFNKTWNTEKYSECTEKLDKELGRPHV